MSVQSQSLHLDPQPSKIQVEILQFHAQIPQGHRLWFKSSKESQKHLYYTTCYLFGASTDIALCNIHLW